MIDGLRAYPTYAKADLPWADALPSHWRARRCKTLFRERAEKGYPTEPLLASTQSHGVIRKERYGLRTVTAQQSLELLKLVEIGDFVISLRSFQGGIELAHDRGIISPAYTVLEPRSEADASYFRYFLKSAPFVKGMTLFVTGIREGQNIDYERLARAYLPLPPLDEQRLIGRFLDHATGKIDRAIRAKRRVIALLNEQKQVIIHRAVTSGLDPNVPLKDGGVPWLPKIPLGWDVSAVKRLLSRVDYGTSEASSESGVIPVLTMGNIQQGEVTTPKTGGLASISDDMLVARHDLLFTRTNGNPDLVGKVGIFRGGSDVRVTFASYLVRLRVRTTHNPEWLHLVLNSSEFWAYARSHALVNLQTNLNVTRYGQFLVPVPPRAEQDAIVRYVLKAVQPIDRRLHSMRRQVSLLDDYRARLVADVVTGRLDVRDHVAPLSAEAKSDAVEASVDDELLDDHLSAEEVA